MKYQSLIEYAVLLLMAAIVAVVVLGPVGRDINQHYSRLGAKMEAAVNGR